MSSEIVIDAEAAQPIEVTLVGQKYTVRPMKTSLAMSLTGRFANIGQDAEKMVKEIGWLSDMMFGKEQAKAVHKRLYDTEDDLDIPHIFSLFEKLLELSSGNLSTSV